MQQIMMILLLLMFLGICNGAPFSSPCTEEEMLQPITDFHKMVDELKTSGVDHEKKLEEISAILKGAEDHLDKINNTCGEEQNAVEDRLVKFYDNLAFESSRIGLELATNDYDKAKDLFKAVKCKHILQYYITSIYSIMEGLGKIIEVVKRMDDPKLINDMHESIIYTLNSRNINDGKLLVPILRDHIISSKNNDDEQIVKNAKANLKLLAERTISYYPDALNALNEVDTEMADEAIQDIVKQVFTNTLYSKSFDIINSVPIIHLKCVALKALHDKVVSMNLTNSVIATKIYTIADSIRPIILDKEDHANDLIMLNQIFRSATEFSTRLFTGDICRTFNDIDPLNDTTIKKEYDYFAFENPSHIPDLELEVLHKVKENGNLLKINVESNDMRYFFLLKNGNYPVHIDLAATITSKEELSYGNADKAPYCDIKESIEYSICITMYEYLLLSQEEGDSLMKKSLKRMKLHNEKWFSQC